MGTLGYQEILIVGIVAILLFGKRLPEVAKSLGKSYRDFRRGLQDIQSQFHDVDREYRSAMTTVKRVVEDDYDRPTAPKFEPPKFEPPTTEPQRIDTSYQDSSQAEATNSESAHREASSHGDTHVV